MNNIPNPFENPEFVEWFNTRPPVIQEAVKATMPDKFYKFKDSGKQCYIIGYTEPHTENPDRNKVLLIVQKTGVGGYLAGMGLSYLDTNQVFDVSPEDLEPYE